MLILSRILVFVNKLFLFFCVSLQFFYDNIKNSTKAPCEAARIHERHVRIEISAFVMRAFVFWLSAERSQPARIHAIAGGQSTSARAFGASFTPTRAFCAPCPPPRELSTCRSRPRAPFVRSVHVRASFRRVVHAHARLLCGQSTSARAFDVSFMPTRAFCAPCPPPRGSYSSMRSLSMLNFSISFSTVIAARSSPTSSIATRPLFIKIVLLP